MLPVILIDNNNGHFNIETFSAVYGFFWYLKVPPMFETRIQVPEFIAGIIFPVGGAQTPTRKKDI